MGIVIRNLKGEGLIISDPYVDIQRYTGQSHCCINIIEGEKSGEGAEIEENKIYDAIIKLLNKEM